MHVSIKETLRMERNKETRLLEYKDICKIPQNIEIIRNKLLKEGIFIHI